MAASSTSLGTITGATPYRKRPPDYDTQPSVLGGPEDPWSYHKKTVPADVPVRLLPQLVLLVNSENPRDQLQGTLLIRKLTCSPHQSEQFDHIQAIVESGVVPRLITFLTRIDSVDLQAESVWAIRNVASGNPSHSGHVMEHGAVPPLIAILGAPAETLREQAVCALGNMVDDPARRDDILGHGVMTSLLRCITAPTADFIVARSAVRTVANLCCPQSRPPDLDAVAIALPVLAHALIHDDDEIVVGACRALAYVSNGSPARIERVLLTGVLPQVLSLLNSCNASHQAMAACVVNNIATGSKDQRQVLMSSNTLSSLFVLLSEEDRACHSEACMALFNIVRNAPLLVQEVIDAQLVPLVLRCIGSKHASVRREALWCASKLCSSGNAEQKIFVIAEILRVLGHVVQALAVPNDRSVSKVALSVLQTLLEAGEKEKERLRLPTNPYADRVIEHNGFPLLEDLQVHSDNDVCSAADHVVNTFFLGADAPADSWPKFDFSCCTTLGGSI